VIKQFLDSPAYFFETFAEVGHTTVVVVDSYYIDIPVVECLQNRVFADSPQKVPAISDDLICFNLSSHGETVVLLSRERTQ